MAAFITEFLRLPDTFATTSQSSAKNFYGKIKECIASRNHGGGITSIDINAHPMRDLTQSQPRERNAHLTTKE